MAIYIGIKKTTLNSYNITPSDIKCVVDTGSKTSFVLNLTKSDPWTINGTFYIVYKVGTNSYDITSTCFVHSHNDLNIKTIDDLPLNSRVIYCSSLSNSFSGGSGWPSGIIYYFDTVLDVKKSNTWHQKTIPHELAGTSYDYIYHNTNQSTASSGKCTDYGFCPTSSSDGVSIVELYHSTNGVTNATELYTSIINRGETWSSGAYKSWIYDYYRESNTGAIYPARIKGTGRKVFAIHNITDGDCNLAIMYGGSTSATLSNTNYTTGAFGYTKEAYNTWAHHETQDGKHYYYSITVNGHNKFIETTVKLKGYKVYNIKMHTYSEAGIDGIVISEKKLTSASLSSSSTDGITRCSGVDKTVTYTCSVSTSSQTLYIYFKTDASVLKGPGDVDSTGASINNSTISNYSTGDIEIEEVYAIIFNANGGEGGPGKIIVPAGESLNLSTITKPTRSGWSFYKWSKNDSNFNFVPDQFTPTGNATFYAIWDNRPKYTLLSDRSVYCTDDCIATSSAQGSKSIKLFGAPGMICSAGTVTYVADKSKVYPVGSPSSPISGATIQPVGTDNNVTVPAGTPAGDYIASITVYTSASPTSPGSYYGPTSDTTVTYQIPFTIKATTLTYGTVQYMTYTPDGELTNGNITQQKKFPAGRFTISPDSISEYFRVYGVFKQEVSCNNGTKREGNVTVNGWAAMPNFSDIVVPSLGTTISDEYTYTFTNDISAGLVFVASGEGNKLYQRLVLSGVREANTLTRISLSLGSNPINYNTTTTATVTATYTSGSSKDVTSSLSTSSSATSNYIKSGDTSVVTIS